MPEGDSVYRLAARLRSALDGRRIASGELRGGRATGSRLDGRSVMSHDTHGKHLLTRFDDGRTLHTHLRMQGSWTVTRPGKSVPAAVVPRVRVRMRLDDGTTAWGVDVPVVELLATADEARLLGDLGPDPLRADWDAGVAARRLLRDPARAVIAALLDQHGMAGLGNLWANEVCFLRGLYPWRRIGDVDVDALVERAATSLRASARLPGMYQVTTGTTRRRESHWVVGRAGRPCLRCGSIIRVRAAASGDPEQRRTWWCPSCQRATVSRNPA